MVLGIKRKFAIICTPLLPCCLINISTMKTYTQVHNTYIHVNIHYKLCHLLYQIIFFYFSICCFGLFIVHVSCSCMLEVLVSIGTFFGSYHTDVESLLWIVAMVLKNHLWIKTPYPKLAKKPVEILDRLKFVSNLLFSKRLSLNYFFFELSNFYLKMRHFSKSILNMLRICKRFQF